MANRNADTDKILEEVLRSHKTKIRIIGTGGAGNNTVTRLLEVGIKGVDVIAVNTDAQDLLFAHADSKVLIGKTHTNGLGAGSDPQKGEEAAKENVKEIEEALESSDMVFVTCGLGGGTGTGSAPIIADVARRMGALTIGVVTLPFEDEGVVRWENARQGLEQLQEKVDTVIVVQNDRLLDLVPDMPLNSAFKVADEILVNAVKGITELVTEKGLVNLDFADVRTIMQNGGLAMIGIGECESEKGAAEAAEKALQNPLLDVDINGAKSALINITGGKEMSLKSAKTIMKIIAERLDPAARIIWGARLDDTMGQSIRVMVIVTCLKAVRRTASEVETAIKKSRNGNSNLENPKTSKAAPDSPLSSKKAAPPAPPRKNRVFSEIFLDESRADLMVLEEAVKGLAVGHRAINEKFLREIKNACASIYNTAELFAFDRISEFSELVAEVTDRAIKGEFDLSETLLDLYHDLPLIFSGMIADDEPAYELAEVIKQKFVNVQQLLKMPPTVPNSDIGNGDPQNGDAADAQPKANTLKKSDAGFSDIKEAVDFVEKLF
ncbi:MAG TPA: cell division protein FtsZ [bacterium]